MEIGARFEFCGMVRRKWVANSRKFGTVTIDVPGERGSDIVEGRSFSNGPIEEIDKLIPGMIIQIKGFVSTEPRKDKKGVEIMVDGYKAYHHVHTIKTLEVDPTSKQNAPSNDRDPGPSDDDEVPKGW